MSKNRLKGLFNAVGNAADRWRFFVKRPPQISAHVLPSGNEAMIASLREHGYAMVQNYYTPEHCATLCGEIDKIITQQPDVVQSDPYGADMRVFGAEHASSSIMAFHNAELPIAIGEHYGRRRLVSFSTLAGRITARRGNLGSGQGWHRDTFHFQYKSMVYLTDVGPESGPFQLLDASHLSGKVFSDTVLGGLQRAPKTRLTDAQANALASANPGRLKTFMAPAGTLLLFDSSTIHRGSPIKSGTRYALTNYYFEPDHVVPAVVKKFAPYARALVEAQPA
jgi:hypothetical protein